MRRYQKLLLLIAVGGLSCLALLWWGFQRYIGSERGRSYASDRLSQVVGMPVLVDDVSVGRHGVSLKLKVFETSNGPSQPEEWLRVEQAESDISLADLLMNRASPTYLKAHGVSVSLKLDRQGNLLTRLPSLTPKTPGGPSPSLNLENAKIQIQQEGKPPFTVTGINLQLTPEGATSRLSGTIRDPQWGEFQCEGQSSETGDVRVHLSSPDSRVDIEKLRSLPLVPAAVWHHMQPSGQTAVQIRVEGHDLPSLRYEVVLEPSGRVDLHLPDLGGEENATFKEVGGTVKVTSQGIDWKNGQAKLAGGTIRVNARADLDKTPAILKLDVSARDVDVRRLPSQWDLPRVLEGKLRGDASLEVRVNGDGTLEPRGGGEAVIDLTDLPPGATGDITLKLRSNGKRYHFQQSDSASPPAPRKEKPESSSRLRARGRAVMCAQPPKKNGEEPSKSSRNSTIDAALNLRNIDVGELLKRLNVPIPYRLSGKVDSRLTIAVPLEKATTLDAYKFSGHLESPRLTVEDLVIENVSADLTFADGVLTLVSLKGTLPHEGIASVGGSFTGKASAQIEPPGDLTAALDLKRLPLGILLRNLVSKDLMIDGNVDGRFQFTGPVNELKNPQRWLASAELRAAELQIFGRTATEAELKLRVEKGTASLADSRLTVEGLRLQIASELALNAPYKFRAQGDVLTEKVVNLRKLLAEVPLPFGLEGQMKADGTATGTLSPLAYAASGSISATDVTLGVSKGNRLDLGWAIDEKSVRISRMTAQLFNGTITGDARLPFQANQDGTFDLAFSKLDAALVSRSLEKFPIRLTGDVSGKLNGKVTRSPKEARPVVAGDLELTAEKLTVQGIPADRLTGSIRFAEEAANYQLEGHTLGGTFDVKGRYPFRQEAVPEKEPSGQLQLRNINLGALASALKQPSLAPLGGTVNLLVQYDNELSTGSGRLELSGLSWDKQNLSERIVSSIRLKEKVLTISDLSGPFAGGQLRGFARFVGSDPRRNFFKITATRVDSQKLLAPIPSAKSAIKGSLTLTLQGRLNEEFSTGSAHVELDRGTLFGIALSGLQVPFQWTAMGRGSGEVIVRNAYSQASLGRVTGDLTYRWGLGDRLSGQIQFQNLTVRSLLGEGESSKLFGAGRLSGRLDLGGSDIRSVKDIRGTLRATLNQTSVRELPILNAASPFLNISGLTSPFQAGDITGRLNNGIFSLERLALSNSTAQLFAQGNILLPSGRLDLNVVGLTGNFSVGARGLSLLAGRIPAFGPVPLGLIQDISDFLSNRTIRLAVGGTVDSPIVRVNTSALLTDEAVRFFVGRYVLGAAGIESLYSPSRK